MKIHLLTMNTFLLNYEIAAAFTPEDCLVDPIKVLQLDIFKTSFICVCGQIYVSFVSLRQHLSTGHAKLSELIRTIPATCSRYMTNKEIIATEDLLKQREELCHVKDGKSLIGTQEEQIVRVVGLISFYKLVTRNYAQS